MNRPWSLRQYFASKEAASLAEDYLFVIETDHLLLRPPRNRATEASPVAFGFYYMTYKYDARKLGPVIRRWHDPDDVDPVGPSPLIVHKVRLPRRARCRRHVRDTSATQPAASAPGAAARPDRTVVEASGSREVAERGRERRLSEPW